MLPHPNNLLALKAAFEGQGISFETHEDGRRGLTFREPDEDGETGESDGASTGST